MLKQVLHLAYNTGLHVNIDLKNGYRIAKPVAEAVLKCGMIGRVVYALNGSGMDGIKGILEIDPDARFIDCGVEFAATVEGFSQREKDVFVIQTMQVMRKSKQFVIAVVFLRVSA